MPRLQLVKLLLMPSFSSGTAVLVASFVIAGGGAWSYISNNQLFYDTIFGIYGIKTLLIQAPDSIWTLKNIVFGSSIAYYTLLVVCGIIAGLTTYTILEIFRRAAHEASEVLEGLQTQDKLRQTVLHEDLKRLLYRILILVAWGVYTVFFLTALFPATAVFVQTGTEGLNNSMTTGWGHILTGFGLLVLFLHIHVVLVRLLMLRVRLFGSDDIEIAEQT